MLLQSLVGKLNKLNGVRTVDRQKTATIAVGLIYEFFRKLGGPHAASTLIDLLYAFEDLKRGRQPELFSPPAGAARGRGRRPPSIRECLLRADAIAAAEALERCGLSADEANRRIASVVRNYGMRLGTQVSRTDANVVRGWRENLNRRGRTPDEVTRQLPLARGFFESLHTAGEVLGMLVYTGVQTVQFRPMLGQRPEKSPG
jgi:hypothetical protein